MHICVDFMGGGKRNGSQLGNTEWTIIKLGPLFIQKKRLLHVAFLMLQKESCGL